MSITLLQASGNNANNTTSVSITAGSNVALNSLVVICGMKFSPSTDPWASGDLTKTGGTATIGAISFDKGVESGGSADWGASGIWSFLVTGGGSLTMQLAGAPAGSFLLISLAEFSGNFDSSRVEATNSNVGTTSLTPDSGSVTSANGGVLVANVQLNSASASTIADDGAFSSIYKNQTGTDDNGSAIYRISSTGITDTANWTITGTTLTHWAATIVAYKEVAAAPTATSWLLTA